MNMLVFRIFRRQRSQWASGSRVQLSFNPCPAEPSENSVDPDHLASEEAS